MTTDNPYEPPESNLNTSELQNSSMFYNLGDFSYQRNTKQAFGFYIAYFILLALIGGFAGALSSVITGTTEYSFISGAFTAGFLCTVMSIIITKKKSLFSSFKNLVLIAVTMMLSLFAGALGGMIPVAYMSTFKNTTSGANDKIYD